MTRRERYREGLHESYIAIYDKLCLILPDYWQPYSGVRTFKEQSDLYSVGRNPVINKRKIVTYSQAGQSAHNYGCASDWTVFENEKPLWPLAFDNVWDVYRDACLEVNAKWGGTFRGITDYFHNELPLTASWPEVLEVYRDSGQKAADTFISRNVIVPYTKAQ